MSEMLPLGAGLIVGAAFLFGLSFGLGMLLGRRLDGALEARRAAAEAAAGTAGEPAEVPMAGARSETADPQDTQLKETRGG